MLEAFGFAAVMAATGALCIWIAKRSMRGDDPKYDLRMGHHTRDNTPPDAWAEAHQVACTAMIRAGWTYVLCGVVGALVMSSQGQGLAAVVVLTLVAVGTGVMLWGIFAALNVITRSKS